MDNALALSTIKTYCKSLDVEAKLLDTAGKQISDENNHAEDFAVCQVCKAIQKNSDTDFFCEKSMVYGSYQAERFGGKYIFFCPMGLTFWISNILTDDSKSASIVAGSVLMTSSEQLLFQDILQKSVLPKTHHKTLLDTLQSCKIIPPDIVNEFAEMLFISAVYISNGTPAGYLSDRETLRQNSDISSYIYHIKTMGGNIDDPVGNGQDFHYPIEKVREFLSYISVGNVEKSSALLNEILAHILVSSGAKFEVVKSRILELVVLLSRAALEGGADVEQIFGLNYTYLSQIHSFKTIDELTQWLSKIIIRFTDCVFKLKDVKHVGAIYRAVHYINRNYTNKITLEEVASVVYFSPTYFSKIFKEEMKMNFNAYVNKLRIDFSKKLLLADNSSIANIAAAIGYEDQSYFTKVFKKQTGVSPGQFRISRGNRK